MKKTYNTPMAEKVSFDYTETVTASGGAEQSNTCPTTCKSNNNPCPFTPNPHPSMFGWIIWCCRRWGW